MLDVDKECESYIGGMRCRFEEIKALKDSSRAVNQYAALVDELGKAANRYENDGSFGNAIECTMLATEVCRVMGEDAQCVNKELLSKISKMSPEQFKTQMKRAKV